MVDLVVDECVAPVGEEHAEVEAEKHHDDLIEHGLERYGEYRQLLVLLRLRFRLPVRLLLNNLVALHRIALCRRRYILRRRRDAPHVQKGENYADNNLHRRVRT